MAKKCLPGVICIENMTLLLFIILFGIAVYLFHLHFYKKYTENNDKIVVLSTPPINVPTFSTISPLSSLSTRNDPFNDPYSPPLKSDSLYQDPRSSDIRGVPGIPVNIQTRGFNTGYSQVGILTRTSTNDDMILPLMGRRSMIGRDKWQYYTISNNGNINTKLPVSSKGKSCTNENGCDEIYNNDSVFVEGYKDTFIATVYETGTFYYIPYI